MLAAYIYYLEMSWPILAALLGVLAVAKIMKRL